MRKQTKKKQKRQAIARRSRMSWLFPDGQTLFVKNDVITVHPQPLLLLLLPVKLACIVRLRTRICTLLVLSCSNGEQRTEPIVLSSLEKPIHIRWKSVFNPFTGNYEISRSERLYQNCQLREISCYALQV